VRERVFSSIRAARGRRRHVPTDAHPLTAAIEAPSSNESSVVNLAVYRDGRRISSPQDLDEVYEDLREDEEAFAWIGLYRPTPE
jgi:magnesium transporter